MKKIVILLIINMYIFNAFSDTKECANIENDDLKDCVIMGTKDYCEKNCSKICGPFKDCCAKMNVVLPNQTKTTVKTIFVCCCK